MCCCLSDRAYKLVFVDRLLKQLMTSTFSASARCCFTSGDLSRWDVCTLTGAPTVGRVVLPSITSTARMKKCRMASNPQNLPGIQWPLLRLFPKPRLALASTLPLVPFERSKEGRTESKRLGRPLRMVAPRCNSVGPPIYST